MSATIPAAFDPKALPRWARKYPNVVELCRVRLDYRANVCSAVTKEYRRFLVRQANFIVEGAKKGGYC